MQEKDKVATVSLLQAQLKKKQTDSKSQRKRVISPLKTKGYLKYKQLKMKQQVEMEETKEEKPIIPKLELGGLNE